MDNLFKKANKIIPFPKLVPLYVILILFALSVYFYKINNRSNTYFELEINGIVTQIMEQPKNVFFNIDNNWYLIKDEIIDEIVIGDSIVKKKDSYEFVLLNEKRGILKRIEKKNMYIKVEKPIK